MNRTYSVILKPYITEKSALLKEGLNQYAFKVAKDANKVEIRNAVQELFNVKVADVRTINYDGKSVRFGLKKGRRADWKKAIVTLKAGEKIALLEVA
ncbi:MAG: 50S ribosomal protein L23 [Nitrospirota bacterium]|nr:50S ribosomal protein L23 [Nitrospirota bacterium]